MLLSRYLKFYRSLIDSPKFTVRYLARIFENDQRTVLGTTLQYLSKQCHIKKDDLYKINPQLVKSRLMFDPVPPECEWASKLAIELLAVRNNEIEVKGFTDAEIETLLEFACTC